eukprot:6283358-Amphidinium_carterae.2
MSIRALLFVVVELEMVLTVEGVVLDFTVDAVLMSLVWTLCWWWKACMVLEVDVALVVACVVLEVDVVVVVVVAVEFEDNVFEVALVAEFVDTVVVVDVEVELTNAVVDLEDEVDVVVGDAMFLWLMSRMTWKMSWKEHGCTCQ